MGCNEFSPPGVRESGRSFAHRGKKGCRPSTLWDSRPFVKFPLPTRLNAPFFFFFFLITITVPCATFTPWQAPILPGSRPPACLQGGRCLNTFPCHRAPLPPTRSGSRRGEKPAPSPGGIRHKSLGSPNLQGGGGGRKF